MAYIFQSVSANQILTAAIYNQTERNIADHNHGADGVLALTATTDAVAVLHRDTAGAEVVNTAVTTVAYTFSVLGGTLGTDRALRLMIIGDYLNNSGVSRNLKVEANFGATRIFSVELTGIPSAAARRGIAITVLIQARGATNSQVGYGFYQDMGAASAGGLGAINPSYGWGMRNNVAEDTTVAKTLEVTYTHSGADANLSAKVLAARLEVLR